MQAHTPSEPHMADYSEPGPGPPPPFVVGLAACAPEVDELVSRGRTARG